MKDCLIQKEKRLCFQMALSYIFMTLIHYYVDKVKVKIVLKGVLSVNFRVINDKTRYQVSQS